MLVGRVRECVEGRQGWARGLGSVPELVEGLGQGASGEGERSSLCLLGGASPPQTPPAL